MKTNLHTSPASDRLTHGRVTATLTSKQTGQHITLRLRCRNKNLKGYINLEQAAIITADVPRSRNEAGEYTSSGDKVGWMHPFKGWRPNKGADKARYWALEQLWVYLTTGKLHDQLDMVLEETCGRCGRPLNDPVSVDRGIGPDCFGEITGSKHAPKEDLFTEDEHAKLLEVS